MRRPFTSRSRYPSSGRYSPRRPFRVGISRYGLRKAYRRGKVAGEKFSKSIQKNVDVGVGPDDNDFEDDRGAMDQLQDLIEAQEPSAKRQMLAGNDEMI